MTNNVSNLLGLTEEQAAVAVSMAVRGAIHVQDSETSTLRFFEWLGGETLESLSDVFEELGLELGFELPGLERDFYEADGSLKRGVA